MLTGNTEAFYVKTAIGAGINGYLAKPFTAEQLVKRISNVIDCPRPFVMSKNYTGPERRYVDKAPSGGNERRKIKK